MMTLLPQTRRCTWALALTLPVLAFALLMQAPRGAGPVCAVVPEDAAQPTLGLLEGPPPPRPACIRVELSPAR